MTQVVGVIYATAEVSEETDMENKPYLDFSISDGFDDASISLELKDTKKFYKQAKKVADKNQGAVMFAEEEDSSIHGYFEWDKDRKQFRTVIEDWTSVMSLYLTLEQIKELFGE